MRPSSSLACRGRSPCVLYLLGAVEGLPSRQAAHQGSRNVRRLLHAYCGPAQRVPCSGDDRGEPPLKIDGRKQYGAVPHIRCEAKRPSDARR